MDERIERLKKKVLSLPLEPGVYIMLDKSGEVIYVGKAKKLKNRVSSYFQEQQSHTEKTRKLVSHINDFNYIVAASEYEALMLECSLIKRHQPQYNILLKDGSVLHYIRVDMREEYPKFSLSTSPKEDGATWFGPYYGRHMARTALEALSEALKLPECSRVFPRDIGKGRPCLNFHMNRCMAPCTGKFTKSEYRALIEEGIALLSGKGADVVEQLKVEMADAAEKLLFEKAVVLRDRVNAVERLSQRQHVIAGGAPDTDVFGFYSAARSCVSVLRYMDGALADKEAVLIEQAVEQDGAEILDAFITQYYMTKTAPPRTILLPFDIENRENLARMLSERVGRKVEILVPQRGEKMELMRLAAKNAREEAERVTTGQDRAARGLELLRAALGLETAPARIEAFDVSNMAGRDVVSSMVVVERGQPKKSAYRRFKMKTIEGQDDYASMRETILRRYQRAIDGDEKFLPTPDLMLIDGGEEHARVARDAAGELGFSPVIYGMVKDNRHRTRALISPDGREIAIAANPQLFGFVGRIQEEAHRFAITYNRELRTKKLYGSELEKIEGVGKTRRAALLKKFGSVKKISAASVDELAEVVTRPAAEAVYRHFHAAQEGEGQ